MVYCKKFFSHINKVGDFLVGMLLERGQTVWSKVELVGSCRVINKSTE